MAYYSDSTIAVITTQQLFDTEATSTGYLLDYHLIAPDGQILSYQSNPLGGYIGISDVIVDADDRLLVSGEYHQIGRDVDGIVLSVATNGTIVATNDRPSIAPLKIWPNPAIRQDLSFTLDQTFSGTITATIWDVGGHIKLQKQLMKQQENQTFSLHLPSLTVGRYWLEIQTSAGQRIVGTFIKT